MTARRDAVIAPADRIGLSRAEAAAYVGVSTWELSNLIGAGLLETPKVFQGEELYDRRSLDKYMYDSGYGEVYFIGYDNYVKIGFTIDIRARMKALQTSAPIKLILYHSLPALPSQEAILHEMFADLRLNGEWFNFTNEIRKWIADDATRRGALGTLRRLEKERQ